MKNNFIKLKNLNLKLSKQYKNILIITSRFHKKKDYLCELIKKLQINKNIYLYDEVKKGAPIKNLYEIIAKFQIPDLIIGIGGGSVMDIAKACSCFFYKKNFFNKKNNKKDLSKIKISKKIKSIMVPTILGSGAENSKGSILELKNKKKIAIRNDLIKANFVYIDLDLIKTANIKLKSEALYDCLSHAIETYISNMSNINTRRRSIDAIKFLLKVKSKSFFQKKKNLKKLAIYSLSMGQNLAESSTCLPHRIQYALSEYSNSTHAQGIIALHKGWLKCSFNSIKFLKLCADLKCDQNVFYKKVFTLRNKLGINYSLNDIKVNKNKIPKIVKNVSGHLAADPLYANKNSILNILEHAF